MLIGTTTRLGTGLFLQGDYYDLSQLYTSVHRLAIYYDKAGSQQQYEYLLDWAYEVRKAKEGKHEKKQSGDAGIYYGFRTIWPKLLVTVSLLRNSLQWGAADPVDYGMVAMLEGQLMSALRDYDAEAAQLLAYQLNQGLYLVKPYFSHVADHVAANFLAMRGGRARLRNLAMLQHNYWNPMQSGYQDLIARIEAAARERNCSVEDIEVAGWPTKMAW